MFCTTKFSFIFIFSFSTLVLFNLCDSRDSSRSYYVGQPPYPFTPNKTEGAPWPLPQSIQVKNAPFRIYPDEFQFFSETTCKIVRDGILRYRRLVFPMKSVSYPFGSPFTLFVNLKGKCEELPYMGMDEKYTLLVQSASKGIVAKLLRKKC